MRDVTWRAAAAALMLGGSVACGGGQGPDGEPPPGPGPEPVALTGVQAINDSAQLAAFVTERNQPLSLVGGTTAARQGVGLQQLGGDPSMRLRAEVTPPTVGGQVLEATGVAFDERPNERFAYVSYSKRGEAAIGAVDVYQITNPSRPMLFQRATFDSADVQAIAVSGGRLYLGLSSAEGAFAERAVLDVVTLAPDGRLPTPLTAVRLQLPSFVTTGIHVQDGRVFATSGTGGPNTGGLTVFQASTLARLGTLPLTDARNVAGVSPFVAVMQGTPGRATVVSSTGNPLTPLGTTLPIGGATIPESRGDVAVNGTWALFAAGDGGLRVATIGAGGGTVNPAVIPTPSVPGIPAELSTTNGVAIWRGSNGTSSVAWVFTANGEAGVSLHTSNLPTRTPSQTPAFDFRGRLDFGAAISSNFVGVANRGETLFVAAGLGGLKIVEVRD